MGKSLISIKDVASAQFEFRVKDWAERSHRARSGPQHQRLRSLAPAAWLRLPPATVGMGRGRPGRAQGALERLPAASPDDALTPITLHLANAGA